LGQNLEFRDHSPANMFWQLV